MEKIFLFLYPIKEYFNPLTKDNNSLVILNETIKKRYKGKGYKIICIQYPDKEIYGIDKKIINNVIYTDISFKEHVTKTKDGNYKYPNEKLILKELINSSEIIIGGFHYEDCVKRVGEQALELGLNCIVDIDLTDLFFNLYNTEYFDQCNYTPQNFKEYMINKINRYNDELAQRIFKRNYSSPVYGIYNNEMERKL